MFVSEGLYKHSATTKWNTMVLQQPRDNTVGSFILDDTIVGSVKL